MADNLTTSDFSGTSRTMRAAEGSDNSLAPIHLAEAATSSANFTRPSDTTAYAANDAVNNSTSSPTVMTFTGMARATGAGGIITGATLHIGDKPSTIGDFHLWLFDTSPTMNNDNAAFAPDSGDLANVTAIIPFLASSVSDGTGMRVYFAGGPIPYRCAATGLYGALQTRTGFTPISACTFRVKLHFTKET